MIIRLALALFLVLGIVETADFTCPTKTITITALQGNLPTGSTDLTLIPKGTNCTFSFDIPNGYALLVQLSADFQSINDTISTIDTTYKNRDIDHTDNPLKAVPYWFAATSAQINVIGVTGTSKFFVNYQYRFLNDYTQVKKNTGEYFALSLLSSKSYYTFTSSSGDQVVATYGKENSRQIDNDLDRIFVYDGADISTSKMVGTLLDFGSSTIMASSKNSLTLVNFYATKSTSYVIGNDLSALGDYIKYNVIITNDASAINGTMGDFTGLVAGYTFICTDCNRFYMDRLAFDSLGFANMGYVKFQGMTPTHKREKLISYEPMTYTSDQMPQLIPSSIFTMNLQYCKVYLRVTTVDESTNWQRPYKGRKGYIFSPNLWNINTNPNNMNYEFRNNSQVYNYVVNLDKMSFGLNNDKLTLQIGSGSGNPQVDNLYSRDKTTKGQISSNGNFMKINLNGSPSDDVRISFEIKEASSSTAIGFIISLILTFCYMLQTVH